MRKTVIILSLLAWAPILGGCFSYTHQTVPVPGPTSTTVVNPDGSRTTTTTTTTPAP